MPTYGYACATCGPFEVLRPMAAGASAYCPDCGGPGRRIFAAPALRSLSSGLRHALDAQARSGDDPAVVTTPPPSGRRQRRATDPRQARLPRP